MTYLITFLLSAAVFIVFLIIYKRSETNPDRLVSYICLCIMFIFGFLGLSSGIFGLVDTAYKEGRRSVIVEQQREQDLLEKDKLIEKYGLSEDELIILRK